MTREVVYTCWDCRHQWKGPLLEENAGRCAACGGVRITFVSSPDITIPRPSRRQGRRWI